MLVPVNSQAYIFLCTVFGGMVVGFIYDLFRVSRKLIKTKNIIVYLEDIIFWLLVSLVIFAILFISNAGQIRGYAIVGIILGIILYAFMISHLVVRGLIRCIDFTKRIIVKTYKIIIKPIKFLMKILYLPIFYMCKLVQKIKKIIRKLFGSLLMRVKSNIRNIKIRSKKI